MDEQLPLPNGRMMRCTTGRFAFKQPNLIDLSVPGAEAPLDRLIPSGAKREKEETRARTDESVDDSCAMVTPRVQTTRPPTMRTQTGQLALRQTDGGRQDKMYNRAPMPK